MGQTASQPRHHHIDPNEEPNLVASLPFGDFSAPIFYTENTLHYFSLNNEPNQDAVSQIRKIGEIGRLLLYSYEQLTDIPSILDHINQGTDLNDPATLLKLQDEFSDYVLYGTIRADMVAAIRQYLSNFYLINHEIPKDDTQKIPNFEELLIALKEAYNCAKKKKYDKNLLKSITDFFLTALPVSAFPPPTPNYIPQVRGHNELFTARYVNCHGTSSNGQFLFVLCADSRLQIFPLINMGTLMHPVQRDLKMTVDYKASLIARKTEIVIYSSQFEYTFSIASLFSTPENCPVEPVSKTQKTSDVLCYLSDCFTYARIKPDFTITFYNLADDKKIRTIKLIESQAPLAKEFNQLFPEFDYSLVPIFMNGSYIGFVFVVDPTTTVFRVFSTLTGKHISDELFRSPDQFYSGCTDMVHKAHWVVSLMENNRLGVRRYFFPGSYEPSPYLLDLGDPNTKKSLSLFLIALNNFVIHYAGSLYVSTLFIADNINLFLDFIDLFTKFIRIVDLKKKDDYKYILQIFCVIADLNLRHVDQQCREGAQIKDRMYTIIAELPINSAAFLYFGSLKFFMRKIDDVGISFFVGTFRRIEAPIRSYAIRHIPDSYAMAYIPFTQTNALSQIMPTTPISKNEAGNINQTLLLLHQRIMVFAAINFLESSDKCEQQFDPNQTEYKAKNILNFLYEYAITIIENFTNIMQECSTFQQLEDSFILLLLNNFVMVLSSITSFRVIAEVLTPVFAPLISKIVEYITTKNMDINDESDLSHMILGFVFLYSKLIATLLHGGDLSDFDKQFLWLMKDVVTSVEESPNIGSFINTQIEDFSDKQLNDFIHGQSNIMNLIYKKFKPMMNKKLPPKIQEIDRLCLLAICRWTGYSDELLSYDGEKPFSPGFRSALECMMHTRSQVRSMIQQGNPIDDIITKCIMLLRFNRVKAEPTAQEVSNFLFTKQSPEMIIQVMKQKHLRNDLTLVGFDLAARILDLDNIDIFTRLFSQCLAQITDFEGLGVILSIFKPSPEQNTKITKFFNRILDIIQKNPYPKLVLVSYRFFRDCSQFPEIESKFLQGVLNILDDHPKRFPVFAVAMSLIPRVKFIPETLKNLDLDKPVKLLLLAECLKVIDCPDDFFKVITKFFWKTPTTQLRIMCRVVFHACKSQKVPRKRIRSLISKVSQFIGKQIVTYGDLQAASEMVWLMRKMLNDDGNLQKLMLLHFSTKNLYKSHRLRSSSVSLIRLNSSKDFNDGNNDDEEQQHSQVHHRRHHNENGDTDETGDHIKSIPIQPNSDDPNEKEEEKGQKHETKSDVPTKNPISSKKSDSDSTENQTETETGTETEEIDEAKLCGLFAILNGYTEVLRPYCNVRIHFNRSSYMDCIAAFDDNEKIWVCYPLPFNLKSKVLQMNFSVQDEIYATDLETVTPQSFPDFNFILRYFDHCFQNTTAPFAPCYVKTLTSFSKYSEFTKLLTPEHIKTLSDYLMSFNDINVTMKAMIGLKSKTIIPSVCGFSVLHFKNNQFNTYLSPQIKKHDAFDVTFRVKSSFFNGYFGVITDNQDRFYTRYSLIHFPSGRWYPFNTTEIQFKEDDTEEEYKEITFTVDRGDHKFIMGDHKMIFPIGSRFKVLIAVPQEAEIEIKTDFSCLDINEPPSIKQHRKLFGNNKSPLYTLPESIISLDKTVWADIDKYEPIPDIVSSMNVGLKVMENFINPPDYIPIHPGFATDCSQDIIDSLYKGYNRTLVDQWCSVILMRILRNSPEKVDDLLTLTKLFILLIVPLENFAISRFNEYQFPFDLDEPVWQESTQTNALFMLFEGEAKEALRVIIQKPHVQAKLCEDVQSMTTKNILHLLAFPHHYHTYYPPGSYPATLKISSPNAIITMNSFHPVVTDGIQYDGHKYDLPFIKAGGESSVQLSVLDRSLSILSINPNNNSWVYDSAFELILIMKSFTFFQLTPDFRTSIKSALIDCIVCQSPFIFKYLPQIMEFFQLHMPPSPFDKNQSFIQHLQLLGSFLKSYTGPEKDRIQSFYHQEQEVMTSRYAVEIANFFPEFFSVPVVRPPKTIIKIPRMNLDPAAIKEDLASYIKMLRMYSIHYDTLVGFPFWDILPLWLRISGSWSEVADKIDPTFEQVSREVIHVMNPSMDTIEIILTPNKNATLNERSLVMLSDSAEFTNAVFINSKNITTPIETTAKDTYMSLIDIRGLWKSLHIKVHAKRVKKDSNSQNDSGMPKMLDPRAFHAQFLEEMEEFAIKWTKQDTEKLVMLLPRYALREPKFATVQSIAKGSSLCLKYSQNVVLLRAAIIHHFNFIRYKHYADVPKHLWDSMSSFVSIEDAADALTDSIKCTRNDNYPTFQIDRRAAHRLIVDGNGSPSKSIICQLTRQFKKCPKAKLQCKARPWKIRFAGEQAIDAGGPSRELMTEAASSIFEPTTELTVRVPNGRRGEGKNQMTYIPYDKTGRRYDDYQTIGTFIGMILRTGFSQDLPFAPLVWKFMAKEKITVDDIVAIDSEFGEHIKQMREAANEPEFETHYMFSWAIEQWDGSKIILPGHSDGSIVKQNQVEQYVTEAIQYRIRSIFMPLKEMRKAFQTNVNFKKHNLLTGSLLSRMAQGSSVISTEHLKSITVYSTELPGGSNNPYVVRYWKAVDRLNDEQKKLLLRFITTLTRLPNPAINPSFKLQIDKMAVKNPDQVLPTASTCFNRLHLPAYSDDDIAYQKLLYAITFCQTMENQ